MTSQLSSINDTIGGTPDPNELTNQSAFNYQYDSIGNLKADAQSGITGITWNVYGKILSITKSSGTIYYTYDASGNRISKTASGITTWYVRDATGNVMSIYASGDATKNSGALTQSEIPLYGSSRLGILNLNVNCTSLLSPTQDSLVRGSKLFELTNHLGNVLATISDKKLQHTTGGDTVDYYNPEAITAGDYYAFGMAEPGRSFNNANYRYGFNGKENDNEVKGTGDQIDYGERIFDPRVGRWNSIDPLQKKYPGESPYAFVSNSVLFFADEGGKDKITTLTIVQKDGKTAVIKIRDRSQFAYFKDQNYGGSPILYKRDIYENDLIDYRKNPDKKESPLQKEVLSYGSVTYPVSASEYYGHMAQSSIDFLSNLVSKQSGEQSNLTLDGYKLFGSSTNGDPEDFKKLPQGGPGTELLDLSGMLNALSTFRDGGSPAEFLKEGSKLKGLIETVENLTNALEKAVQGKEEMDKHPERYVEVGPNGDSCVYCHNIDKKDSMDPGHGRIVPTKGTHIIKKHE